MTKSAGHCTQSNIRAPHGPNRPDRAVDPARYTKDLPQVLLRSVSMNRREPARRWSDGSRFILAANLVGFRRLGKAGRRQAWPARNRHDARDDPRSRGPCADPDLRPTGDLSGARRARHRRQPQRNPGASGAVNRLLGPDSVRHMSVTTATQRLTAARQETRRHSNKKAREAGYTQLTGYLRRWWQVLGSNHRRLRRWFTGG